VSLPIVSITRLRENGKEFDKFNVRLVVQGQHMRQKGEDSFCDYDAFSFVSAASGFRTNLSLALHNKICSESLITSIFLRFSFKENYCPETVTMERCMFLHFWNMMKILSECLSFLSHFTACPLQAELGTPL